MGLLLYYLIILLKQNIQKFELTSLKYLFGTNFILKKDLNINKNRYQCQYLVTYESKVCVFGKTRKKKVKFFKLNLFTTH